MKPGIQGIRSQDPPAPGSPAVSLAPPGFCWLLRGWWHNASKWMQEEPKEFLGTWTDLGGARRS